MFLYYSKVARDFKELDRFFGFSIVQSTGVNFVTWIAGCRQKYALEKYDIHRGFSQIIPD
jgi:hypothetical protein